MADRFPIIIESNEQQIQELSAGDGLDLTKSGVVNANYVHSAGVNAGVVTATSFIGDGSQITNIPAGGGSLEATASGTLADGSTVIVNADGTVSVVSETTTPASVGSPAIVENSNTSYISSTYDSTSNRVVIAYRDQGNSGYGTAVVGQVSGTNITFGTRVVFESASTVLGEVIYDSTNNKVVIAYSDYGNSQYGTAIVGTVSGISISFGSPVVFVSAALFWISLAFDSTNGKVVVFCMDGTNSYYGTARVGTVSGTSISFGSATVFDTASPGHMSSTYDPDTGKVVVAYYGSSSYGTAVVGTVSGTSISFGTPVVFESASSSDFSTVYDPTNQKIVIAYKDNGNSYYGTAVVGTVSGTTISFGTPVVFNSATTQDNSAIFNSTNNKVVIAYRDVGNSQYGTVIEGTVSGTSISFGSEVVFESAATQYESATYDLSNDKVVIAYTDNGNSNYGTAVVVSSSISTSNLTAENFIGISDGAYTNGQTATIQIAGSVDDAQSGLTPGQQYYVQGDGTLSETADSPSVLAGTAIAATKLMIG